RLSYVASRRDGPKQVDFFSYFRRPYKQNAMKLEEQLLVRSENKCELCQREESLKIYEAEPGSGASKENGLMICNKCQAQIEKKEELDSAHWACLTTSM